MDLYNISIIRYSIELAEKYGTATVFGTSLLLLAVLVAMAIFTSRCCCNKNDENTSRKE